MIQVYMQGVLLLLILKSIKFKNKKIKLCFKSFATVNLVQNCQPKMFTL